MKIWIFVLITAFNIYNSRAQRREVALISSGGDTFFLGPGGKPDKVFNYGALVHIILNQTRCHLELNPVV